MERAGDAPVHVPSDEEWKGLEMHLGMSHSEKDNEGFRGQGVGSNLASSSELWQEGYLKTGGEFGKSGFIAITGGGRRYNETLGHLGDNANSGRPQKKAA